MANKHWTLDDLPWDQFDASKVDPEVLKIVKAAAMVEYNGRDYATYLCNVFHDDPEFQQVARDWAVEEVQHGAALGRWAMVADPSFDFEARFARFTEGFKLTLQVNHSIRGSRSGELIARCMVETGTSSYYTALAEATTEPVLRAICKHVAADELRHYKLFYSYLGRYLDREALGRLSRLRVAFSRIAESEDDELAYAYYAANAPADETYDRKRHGGAYMRRAFGFYRQHHVDRGVAMIFKACGLKPHTRLFRLATRFAWWQLDGRVRKLTKLAA